MTRDDAKKIMLRIMARIEDEKAIHLDSGVEEIMAGMALETPRPGIPEKDTPHIDHVWITSWDAVPDNVEVGLTVVYDGSRHIVIPAGVTICKVGLDEHGTLAFYDENGDRID